MKLLLTKKIQEAVKIALKTSNFSIKNQEEAIKISEVKLDSMEKYPISKDLVKQVADILGT